LTGRHRLARIIAIEARVGGGLGPAIQPVVQLTVIVIDILNATRRIVIDRRWLHALVGLAATVVAGLIQSAGTAKRIRVGATRVGQRITGLVDGIVRILAFVAERLIGGVVRILARPGKNDRAQAHEYGETCRHGQSLHVIGSYKSTNIITA
jgi:hypothetical protein